MKKILKLIAFLAILLILAGSFFSCNKKEEPFLTVDETFTIENAEAGTYSIAVNSNGAWTATVENADWCTLNKSNGSGNSVITVTIAENTLYTPRSATIKIISENLEKLVTIKQHAATGEEAFPIELPFIEYSLTENCQWINLAHNGGVSYYEVVIINSDEKLKNYIRCSNGGYPKINFKKHTLLLASGIDPSGVSYCAPKMLKQLEHKYYELEIGFKHNMFAASTPWQVAILIDKTDAGSMIDLKFSVID